MQPSENDPSAGEPSPSEPHDRWPASGLSAGAAAVQRRVLPPPLRGIRAAFVFMTRIPLGGFPYCDADFRWAPAHFPLVGFVIGCLSALVFIAAQSLGLLVAASLSVAVAILLTGAFHEDGLADTADALGGAHGGRRTLEILKDSRIGTYGAAALFMSLLLRVSVLAQLGAPEAIPAEFDAPAAIVLAACAARLSPVWLMATLPYVTGEGAKSSTLSRAGKLQALVATAWTTALLAVLVAFRLVSPVACVGAAAMALGSALFLGRWFRARLGGVTGDFLGAAEQVGEVLVLLTLLAVEGGHG